MFGKYTIRHTMPYDRLYVAADECCYTTRDIYFAVSLGLFSALWIYIKESRYNRVKIVRYKGEVNYRKRITQDGPYCIKYYKNTTCYRESLRDVLPSTMDLTRDLVRRRLAQNQRNQRCHLEVVVYNVDKLAVDKYVLNKKHCRYALVRVSIDGAYKI